MKEFENASNTNEPNIYSTTLPNGNTYHITTIEKVNSAVHKGTIHTDLYIATINTSNENIYAGFELDKSQEVTNYLCDAIIQSCSEDTTEDYCNYLGVLQKSENNMIEPMFKSKVSQRFLNEYARRLIEKEKKKPKFLHVDEDIYKSININTGEELYLSDVKKICKDSYQTYLYTSRLSYDATKSFDVIFESDFKLSNITFYKNQDEITGITNLISIPTEKLSKKHLNYIGKLFDDGTIQRDIKESSESLLHELKKMQKQYKY